MRTMFMALLCFASFSWAGGWITGSISHVDPQWTNFNLYVKVGSTLVDMQSGSVPGSYTTCELPVGSNYTVICTYLDDNGMQWQIGLVANAIRVKEGMYTLLDFCFNGNGTTDYQVHVLGQNGPMSLTNGTWAGIKNLLQ